jgi:uncharacterized membrane protein
LTFQKLRRIAGVLALAGLAVAGYLTWAHYSGGSVICVREGGCETVQKSSYSEIAGIPVAVFGVAFYATMLALLALDSEDARFAAAALAFVGVLFSGYLLVLQAFVIDAYCVWCLASDVVIAPALAVTVAFRLRSGE